MGYLIIDQSATETNGKRGEKLEYDTVSCKHCQCVLRIVKRQKEGAWCFTCGGSVCIPCSKTGQCVPFMKKVECQIKYDIRKRAMFREFGI